MQAESSHYLPEEVTVSQMWDGDQKINRRGMEKMVVRGLNFRRSRRISIRKTRRANLHLRHRQAARMLRLTDDLQVRPDPETM